MKIVVVSRDSHLYRLCRVILSEFPGRDWQLTTATPRTCPLDAELYIWDGQANLELPRTLEPNFSRHLFLLNRSDVAKLHENAGGAEMNILLKPVTRATLSAFLSLATLAHRDRTISPDSLRADRDEILQCLIQANMKLQEYDQDRTNFLTRAVHDFRTPLTAVIGYCGLLLSEALGPLSEDQKEVLRRMEHSAKRLSLMSSAMFQLSVGRQVKMQPVLRKGDIRQCVEQALHEITYFAEGKQISISTNLEPEPGSLYFERAQIEQVLVNLLENACKFTPRAGEIEIQAYPFFWERRAVRNSPDPADERRSHDRQSLNAYRIDIRNTGAPLPPEHLSTIFEEYTSYAGGQDRSGGGLGLAVSRMIATQHDGGVWAENTDRGPKFSFVLPVRLTEPMLTDSSQPQMLKLSEAS
jgi:signal transduction histidine kinase